MMKKQTPLPQTAMPDWSICTVPWGMTPGWPEKELHLWCADLRAVQPQLSELQATLSPDEQARAARYRFPLDRTRYALTRGLLRLLLGGYLGLAPESLRFHYGPHGKPSLDLSADAKTLHFNVSHSEDLALIAVTGLAEVGIDVERISDGVSSQLLAQRFFSPTEVAWLQGQEEHRRHERFFQLWTRKEACLKAAGTGLTTSLADVEVLQSAWHILDLRTDAAYAAAVALPVPFPTIKTWRWPP